MTEKRCILFSGGGTGGHLFPGLATAARLAEIEPAFEIAFAGSGREFERQHVTRAGYEYYALACRPLLRGPRGFISFVSQQLRGAHDALRLLRAKRPSAVVGLGGWASVPLAHAAIMCRVPLVLLEQNLLPGRANRWLARGAARCCLAFDDSHQFIPNLASRLVVTGTPIRAGFHRSQADHARRLLILGGSGGSRQLNRALPELVAELADELRSWQIVHQTGVTEMTAVRERYAALPVDAEVTEFIADMPAALAGAELVISRAGGTTLAELAAVGLATVLCPLPTSAQDHQRRNANWLAERGACRLLAPETLDDRTQWPAAIEQFRSVISDSAARKQLASRIYGLSRPDAADRVAATVLEVAELAGRRQLAAT